MIGVETLFNSLTLMACVIQITCSDMCDNVKHVQGNNVVKLYLSCIHDHTEQRACTSIGRCGLHLITTTCRSMFITREFIYSVQLI